MTEPDLNYTFGNRMGSSSYWQQQRDAASAQNQRAQAQQQAYYEYVRGLGQQQFGQSYRPEQPPRPIALPASHWSNVLGVLPSATVAEIDKAYRLKAKAAHPDHGGSNEAMSKLNVAHDAAVKERKAA